jgi:dipeptidyl aminopeptidase/acylaminoacyl peptidase
MGRPLALHDLYAFERVSDPALSPDATRVAYTVTVADHETDGYRSRIWLAEVAGGDPTGYSAGPHDHSPAWSPDGAWLAFLRRPDDGAPQLWVLPTSGGDAQLVDPGPVTAYAWAPDSARLAVTKLVDLRGEPADEAESKRRQSAPIVVERLGFKADGAGLLGTQRTHLFVVPVAGGEAQQVTDGDFFVSAPAWSPDADRIAVLTAVHDTRDLDAVNDVAVVSAAGGELQVLTDWEGIAGWVGWLDRERLLLTGVARVDTALHTSLFTLRGEGGKPEPLLPDFDRNVMTGGPGYPGAPPQIIGDEIIFCARDRGTVHIYATTVGTGGCDKVIDGDQRLVSGCSAVGQRLAYVLATPASIGELVTRRWGDAEERQLTCHNRFLDDREIFVLADRVFTTADGAQVHGRILTGRTPSGPRPLLLDIHGGPHNAWGPALDDVHLYHQHLAAQGWAVLLLNTVGSDGYGQDWYAGLRGGWGRHDENQFLAAIDALVTEGLVDPARVAVTGYSYGGYMTNWLLTRTRRFAAAVTGGCVTNLTSFYGSADLGALLLGSELGAELSDGLESYLDLSPLRRAATVSTPTLILHGEQDHRCPVGQAEELFAALRRAGTRVRMVRYPDAGHLFILQGRPSHRLHYNQQIVDWVTEHTA